MDAINSVESRKLSAIENMQRLEKAILYFTIQTHFLGLLTRDPELELTLE